MRSARLKGERWTVFVVAFLCATSLVQFDRQAQFVQRQIAEEPKAAAPVAKQTPDVFIQQEHEGNLNAPSEEATGNLFTYYRPTRIDQDLIDPLVAKLSWPARTWYGVRKKYFQKGDAWEPLPLSAKIKYLEALEARVGKGACWTGHTCEILEKKPGAPKYLAKNPHMESPPGAPPEAPLSFLYPEIVTDRDQPALSVEQALNRAREVITSTGHAGTHFHVFVRVSPEQLGAQKQAILSTLQSINDEMFLEGAQRDFSNITHPNLRPWHQAPADTVAKLIDTRPEGVYPHDRTDPGNPKAANLAFRYWGMQEGKAVFSLELRGVAIPWTTKGRTAEVAVRGMEETYKRPEYFRDYSEAKRYLDRLVGIGQSIAEGKLKPTGAPPVRVFDLARAEALIAGRAKERGIKQYVPLKDMAKAVTGSETVPGGLLFPFSDPHENLASPRLRVYIDGYLDFAAQQAQYRDYASNPALLIHQWLPIYAAWARGKLKVVYDTSKRPPASSACPLPKIAPRE